LIILFIQGFNALHYAAASGNPYHALIGIFEHASNEVVTGQSVITAMHLAAAQGYEEALAVLLSKVSLIFSLLSFFIAF
jgi:ankyrin repeat protein